MQLYTGTRYASEHIILEPEYYQQALDRGFLSGEFGRKGGLLFFSEGAHFRTCPNERFPKTYGFLFDPDNLEQNYRAVPSQCRYSKIIAAMEDSDNPKWQMEGQRLKEVYDRVMGADAEFVWGKAGKSDIFLLQQFGKETGLDLTRTLLKQREIGAIYEPEFVTKERIPITEAIGITDETGVYWIDPNRRGNNPNRWNLFPVGTKEYGGLEPGSFAVGTQIQSLIIPDELKTKKPRRFTVGGFCWGVSPRVSQPVIDRQHWQYLR